MRKYTYIRRLIAALLIMATLCLPVFAKEAATEQSCHSIDAQHSVLGNAQLITNAQSCFLYEVNTGTVMYNWNADTPMYPASLVKIMTALIVAERGTMTDAVTVRKNILDTVDPYAISANLKVDEVLTVEDLMYCMMVQSANDAAAVLANHVAGSQDAFVAEMNRYAKEIGCTGTNFVNVHGLHHDDQVTTARDMAKILAHASQNELFNKFFHAERYSVPATNKTEADKRNYVSTNNLIVEGRIYYDDRVVGSRAGTTAMGDRCVASIANRNGMNMICVVMGSKAVNGEIGFGGLPETKELLNLGFNGYSTTQLLCKDQALVQCKVSGGEADVVLGVSEDVRSILPAGTELNDITFRYSDGYNQLKAPVKKGAVVGSVTLWYENICVGATDLYAMNGVDTPTLTVEQDDKGLDVFGTIVLIIVIVAVTACGVLLAIRWIHIVKIGKHKRNRRNTTRRRK